LLEFINILLLYSPPVHFHSTKRKGKVAAGISLLCLLTVIQGGQPKCSTESEYCRLSSPIQVFANACDHCPTWRTDSFRRTVALGKV